MDSEKACWILEFVLRQLIDDWVAHELLQAIPLPASATTDTRLKKTILLRRIATHLSNSAISEATLDSLELIEELDHTEGKPAMQSMRDAYSAVATECALSHLRGDGKWVDSGGFVDAVNRIWKFRIPKAATWGVTRLISAELKIRRKEMETAVGDMEARCNLLRDNEKGKAMEALGLYLKDALQEMGPPFLEMIAKEELKKFSEVKIENKCNTMSAFSNRGSGTMDLEGHLLELGECRSAGVQGLATGNGISAPGEMIDQFIHEEVSDDEAGPGPTTLEDSVIQLDMQVTSQVLEIGLKTSQRTNLDFSKEAGPMKLDGSGLQLDMRGTSQVQEVGLETSRRPNGDSSKLAGECPDVEVHNVEALHKEGILELNIEASHKEKLIISNRVQSIDPLEHVGEYDRLPTSDVSKMREALKSSCAELQAAVTDPLPHAIDMAAEILINMNNVVSTNQLHHYPKHGDDNDPGVVNNIPGASGLDGNVTCTSLHVDHNEKARSSIMDRNPTAHTYEWDDDSIESASEISPNASKKIQLGSSKKRRDSPLKTRQVAKCARRRTIKRWTVLEEDTLREAVKRHGKGNWKFILNCYSNIFEDRTEVDLKDKWRNMTRQ